MKLLKGLVSGKHYWIIFFSMLLLSFLVLQLIAGNTLLRFKINNSLPDVFKVYWTTDSQTNWSEHRSVRIYVNERKRHYAFYLPVPLSDIKSLRFDAPARPGAQVHIQRISIHSLYWKTMNIGSATWFERLVPNHHVGELKRERGLEFVTLGNDAWFEMQMPRLRDQPEPALMIGQAILLALLLTSLVTRLPWLFGNLRWVPVGLLIAATSVGALATVSSLNTHPDEIIHIRNAEYYARHYAAPEVCSIPALRTYSGYGVSRLDKREIAYYVGGRYLELLAFVPGVDYLKLRYLNVALFFILVFLAFQHVRARYLFLPLLLTPQSWYLFAYYNSDAFSLFFVAITAYQVFIPQSMLRRLLVGERPSQRWLWVIALGLVAAMQFWLKLNFVFYPLFLGMLAVAWWLVNRRRPRLQNSLPILFAFVLGSSLFLSWEISRHAINDFEMAERVQACQEKTAETRFKSSTPLDQTDATYRLRDKGVSLSNMLIDMQWPERIFFSGLGSYGYTEYGSDRRAYMLAAGFVSLFILYVCLAIWYAGTGMARMAVLVTIASIAGVTVAAVIDNWFQSFQPQGRYLLVYLPILGSLMAMYWQKLNIYFLGLLAGVPFLLGLYSFYAIALVEIPK